MYRLKRTNGDFYATVPHNVILGPNMPATIPAPINLIGRNKVSYGEAQNENFLWLVENFASNSTPKAPVRGQLWYDYSNDDGTGSGGELKIAPADNVAAAQWLTVPVVAETNIEPSRSHTGRMIIYKKNQLKIRMNNEWHSIATVVPQDKLFQALLDVNNNGDKVEGKFTTVHLTGTGEHSLARFNQGGYLKTDGTIGGTTEGVLKYGASYQWEADIIARQANNSNVFKVWKVKGAFSVKTERQQQADTSIAEPDPRRINVFDRTGLVYEVIHQSPGTENWDVYSRASTDAPPSNVQTAAAKLDGPYYGLEFVGNANVSSGATIKTGWSVFLRMTGIPTSTHADYQNL